MMAPAPRAAYDYATIRLVPRIERGEYLNVGVVLFCRVERFLGARIAFDQQRTQALAPALSAATRETIAQHLAIIQRICVGGSTAGPIGQLPPSERFHWLTAPRSTILQPSPIASGLCSDPAATLDRLFHRLVAPPDADGPG